MELTPRQRRALEDISDTFCRSEQRGADRA